MNPSIDHILNIFMFIQSFFNENLEDFQWVTDSSAPGIAVISSSDVKVIITYSAGKKELIDFFNDIRKHLGGEEEEEEGRTFSK